MKNKKTHILHYLILGLVLLAGLILLFLYQNKPRLQFYIGFGLAVSYFSWGIIHHYLTEGLYKKHVVEYGMLAVLAVIMLKILLI